MALETKPTFAPCAAEHTWKQDWMGGSTGQRQSGLVKPKGLTASHDYIKSSIAVRLRQVQSWCRGLGGAWPFTPPLPPTRAAGGTSGACSQNAAWRFWGQASGTGGGHKTTHLKLEFRESLERNTNKPGCGKKKKDCFRATKCRGRRFFWMTQGGGRVKHGKNLIRRWR